jgi:23S rRNA (cytidine1920-2'-O)/16S rRNA (cytidine1409-2'-O)-methyltransferase
LDAELVRRGMAASRARARDVVLQGQVLVSGSLATKPERLVADSEPIEMAGPPRPFVSRGGEKLAGALDEFAIDVQGLHCVDLGSSTGGFTDCLLQRGAAHVVAVDVGRGQLDWRLRNDDRVDVRERTDVRNIDRETLGRVDLVTADLSFISLRTVMPSIARIAGDAPVIVLVKPQFEVGRERVPKGGVVKDPAHQTEAVAAVASAAAREELHCLAGAPSVLEGAQGNREFFLLLRRET